MNSKDIKAVMGKPQLLKLKEVAKGIKVDQVLGNRVLVRKVVPYTEMDEVEQKGLLFIPETVKEANTPLPSTGIVVQLGLGVSSEARQLLPEGTAVMFSRYAGSDVIVDQDEFRIMEVPEIMCTLARKEEDDATASD